MLRYTPGLVPPLFAATRMVLPRGATTARFVPVRSAAPSAVKVLPPSVVRRMPVRSPPLAAKAAEASDARHQRVARRVGWIVGERTDGRAGELVRQWRPGRIGVRCVRRAPDAPVDGSEEQDVGVRGMGGNAVDRSGHGVGSGTRARHAFRLPIDDGRRSRGQPVHCAQQVHGKQCSLLKRLQANPIAASTVKAAITSTGRLAQSRF